MKIYNTPLKKIQTIELISPPAASVYTCGPTVYDYPHIGNWFTFIRYDLLIRVLKLAGYHPKWVLNITDVGHLVSDADEGEDKLEKGARREGKTAWEIAEFYTNYFVSSLDRLNIDRPTFMPRATEHIPEQINLIKALEKKGFTYVIDDGVYFDISKFPDYSKFAHLDLKDQRSTQRITPNPEKRNHNDFALWKFSPKDQHRDMEWDSPWGIGFPGWHLECSAMAMKYLGETIDVHGGGVDHIPVHHTNEIAQSEAATGKPFVHYWLHPNHVLVSDKKIAKSEGNGITLEDIEARGYTLEEFRFLVLQSHYRNQSQFSYPILKDAAQSLRRLKGSFSWIYNSPFSKELSDNKITSVLEEAKNKISDALLDDLDTPNAVALLHEVGADISTLPIAKEQLGLIESFNDFISQTLGINLLVQRVLSQKQQKLLEDRDQARKDKDYYSSDRIRLELESEGIGLRDTPAGTTWFPM